MEILDKNPKVSFFVIGCVVTLVILLIAWYMFGSCDSERYGDSLDNTDIETAYLFGIANSTPERFASEQEQVRTPDSDDPPQAARNPKFFAMAMTDSTVVMDNGTPSPSRNEGSNDDIATEHLITRGGAHRAIGDASRNRYLGMAALGANDYEGYVYQGGALSDEQGVLTSTVMGINESPWAYHGL